MKSHYQITDRTVWRRWVTPELLRDKPIHRWYVFPHSFTRELVHKLIDEWGINDKARILDPFAGAGTTLLAAKERAVPATGYDLSPLAVMAGKTKVANYSLSRLETAWISLKKKCKRIARSVKKEYPELIIKALPGNLLAAFENISNKINSLPNSETEKDFFRLALLAVLPLYSRAVATGGWLKWVDTDEDEQSLINTFSSQVEMMLQDVREATLPRRALWKACQADVRKLPDKAATYSAVITSPPYPNRHDYTRVFGVELMFGFLGWDETRSLRYQSFHSHPEARPNRPKVKSYQAPALLKQTIKRMKAAEVDPRIPDMLEGYFLDMYLCLKNLKRVCKSGARIALVLGNVRYSGESVLVDELTAQIGEQAGLVCKKLEVARLRGNSAQQMGRLGKSPSRETVLTFHRP